MRVLDLIRESVSFPWKRIASKIARGLGSGARIQILPPSSQEAITAALEVEEPNLVEWEKDLGALLVKYGGFDFVILPLKFSFSKDQIRLSLPILVKDGMRFPKISKTTLNRLALDATTGAEVGSFVTRLVTVDKHRKIAPAIPPDGPLNIYAWFIKELVRLAGLSLSDVEDVSDKDVEVKLIHPELLVKAILSKSSGQHLSSWFRINAGGLLQDRVLVNLGITSYEKKVENVALKPNELEDFVHQVSLSLDRAKDWKTRFSARLVKKALKNEGLNIRELSRIKNAKAIVCSIPNGTKDVTLWLDDDKWLVASISTLEDPYESLSKLARGKADLYIRDYSHHKIAAVISKDHIDYEALFHDVYETLKEAYKKFSVELARLVRGILEELEGPEKGA